MCDCQSNLLNLDSTCLTFILLTCFLLVFRPTSNKSKRFISLPVEYQFRIWFTAFAYFDSILEQLMVFVELYILVPKLVILQMLFTAYVRITRFCIHNVAKICILVHGTFTLCQRKGTFTNQLALAMPSRQIPPSTSQLPPSTT